jgi:hypothetical protein
MDNGRQLLGKEGERLAEVYLKKKGYKLVERNYRCAAGELDLIVLDRRVVVFVEVKTRTGHGFGTPRPRNIFSPSEDFSSAMRASTLSGFPGQDASPWWSISKTPSSCRRGIKNRCWM